MQHPNSINKIGLMGPFGSGNLGDAAIQTSAIANIRRLNPQAEIYGFSLRPQDTESRHNIPTYPIGKEANGLDYCWWRGTTQDSPASRLTDFWLRWRERSRDSLLQKIGKRFIFGILETLAWTRAYQNFQCLELDLLIVSGGGQLDDYWGGAWGHPFTLLRWCLFAKLNQTKFAVVSTGAGPVDSLLSKLFIRTTLTLADYRSYRSASSQKYVAEIIGFPNDDPVYPDLAFSMPVDNYQPSSAKPTTRQTVGIGPMSYCNPQSWPEKKQSVYTEYLNKLASFAAWLIERGYAIAIFPGQTAHDKLAIADFKKLLNQQGILLEQIVEQQILTVDDLMQQLADIDLAIASRFHGVLLSLLMNKPTLALSYHPKIDALMADTGQSEYCLTIDNFNIDILKDKFITLETNSEAVAATLASKTHAYQSSLAKQYERLFR